MKEFLDIFGGVSIKNAALLLCAIIFLIGCYKKVEKYFSDKAVQEKEYNERINKMLKQAENYPKWHEQSISIRKELNESINGLNKKMDVMQNANDERLALTWRYRILRFDDEIRHDDKHTKEHFDQILEDITEYEKYCRLHKEFQNNKAVLAIDNIKNIYRQCTNEGSFL